MAFLAGFFSSIGGSISFWQMMSVSGGLADIMVSRLYPPAGQMRANFTTVGENPSLCRQ
jgi:hypothetical protein